MQVIIPVDVNTSSDLDGESFYKSFNNIGSNDIILDIGKKTIDLINNIINKSNTIFLEWACWIL